NVNYEIVYVFFLMLLTHSRNDQRPIESLRDIGLALFEFGIRLRRLLKSDDEDVVPLLGFFGDHGRARLLVNDRRNLDRRINFLFIFLLVLDLRGRLLHGFAGYGSLFVLFFRLLVVRLLAVRLFFLGRGNSDGLVATL